MKIIFMHNVVTKGCMSAAIRKLIIIMIVSDVDVDIRTSKNFIESINWLFNFYLLLFFLLYFLIVYHKLQMEFITSY